MVADHPEVDLLQASFPAFFEVFQPLPVLGGIRYVNNNLNEVVAIHNAPVTPVPLNFLCFVAGGTKMVNDLEHSLSQPFCRYFPSIIELEG